MCVLPKQNLAEWITYKDKILFCWNSGSWQSEMRSSASAKSIFIIWNLFRRCVSQLGKCYTVLWGHLWSFICGMHLNISLGCIPRGRTAGVWTMSKYSLSHSYHQADFPKWICQLILLLDVLHIPVLISKIKKKTYFNSSHNYMLPCCMYAVLHL